MPRFNRVFEELGIKYDDYIVPPDVLLGLEKKKDSSKAVAAAEAKKRKGGRAVKQLAKKRKAEVVLETPVESSSARSSAAESNSVASAPAEAVAASGGPEVQASRAVSSVRAPFAPLLGRNLPTRRPLGRVLRGTRFLRWRRVLRGWLLLAENLRQRMCRRNPVMMQSLSLFGG